MQLSPLQRAQIDRLGELQRRVAEFAPTDREARNLAATVASWLPAEADPAESYVLEGDRYTVQISARQNQRRVIDIKGLFRALGQSRFLQLASIPLRALDAILTSDERERFLVEERTGHRGVKTVAKGEVQPRVIEMPRRRRAA